MKNSKGIFQELVNRISIHSNREEVESIAYLILDHLFQLTRTQIMSEKEIVVKGNQLSSLQQIVDRINKHEPVQYVLGETEFYGRRFRVNRSVLIPRPETEDLVRLAISHLRKMKIENPNVLDVGTGSGCIAVSLAAEFPGASVFATDISQAALEVAGENNHHADNRVHLLRHDILTEQLPMKELDVVVSNPPYVAEKEMHRMEKNVLSFEPPLALFVPDNDPLKFYRSIAAKAFNALRPGGFLAVEINEAYGKETASLFISEQFKEVTVVKDLSGKHRIIKALKV